MLDLLPDAPDPATDSPQVFNQKAAAFVLAQKALVAQFNDALGQFNASLAGGAYALPYVFDSGTADADPGPGRLRLSSATQNAATVMRLDVLAGGQDVSSIIDQFDASNSLVKGGIRLVKIGDLSKWLTFDVTARASPIGYRNLSVVSTGGSSASPFLAGDGVLLFFQRAGDRGETGYTSYMKVSDKKANGSSGGQANGTLNIRTLNTVDWNDIAGASLLNDRITLPPGRYEIFARAPLFATGNSHQIVLQNVTDNQATVIGCIAYATGTTQSDSIITGQFSITAQKSFQIYHYNAAATATSNGLGWYGPAAGGALGEFTSVVIKKVANG